MILCMSSKLSKRSPRNGASVVHAGAQVESSAGRTPPHLRSPHSDSGTLPGSPVGLGHPSGVHQVYMNPAPPTTISIIDAPSMTPTPSPPPPPPKRKSSLKRLFMPTWSRTSLPETRNVGGETDTPAVGAQRPFVEPVPVSMPIQPKRKGSLAGRLFRNRSRSLVTEPPDPQEEVVTIPSRQESYVAPNPPERKRSFGQGLFRSRSRTAAVETEDAPSVYSRGESPTTQSVGSKKRFGIFRKTSRDMPATPEAETFHPSGSAVFLGNVPTRSSLDDGAPDSASASTPKRSRNPFNIFRKKSTDSSRGSVEEYAPERAESFPPQEGVTPTSGTFQDMDAPAPIVSRPKPKRSWTDRLLGSQNLLCCARGTRRNATRGPTSTVTTGRATTPYP
ncbi:uncharacterized protein EI90DRAFT_413839 [Cantharellus anzutake]|uniref:uncharacterized protein n=1 Tax=Cantharellus anzutake TaxID=1750568 RepID=UPI0019030AEB|nr:uncharacterized protein EI90DRAFT_413839 [Cantharellus anzutake]KAF8314873.1 hypothetical protein EI90DRAFT_413839 [Cantharellus anzutake]